MRMGHIIEVMVGARLVLFLFISVFSFCFDLNDSELLHDGTTFHQKAYLKRIIKDRKIERHFLEHC